MKIETRKISDLRPWEDNPRGIKTVDFERLKSQIKDLGQHTPLLVTEDGEVLGGNMRLKAYQDLGVQETQVVVVAPKTKAEKLKFALSHNDRVGYWDDQALAELLTNDGLGINFQDYKIDLGEPTDLDKLMEQFGPDIEEDEVPEPPKEPKSKLGEVYELGRHRLMCGDSTKLEDVEKLRGGQRIRAVVTSPPYADQRTYNIGEFDWDNLMVRMTNTWKDITGYDFYDLDVLINLGQVHRDGEVWFYWQSWLDQTKKLGWPLFGMYVWDKLKALPGEWNGRLAPAHEYIFHFHRGSSSANKTVKTKTKHSEGKPTFRQKDGSLREASSPNSLGQDWKIPDSVIRVTPETGSSEHPARYPVRFVTELIKTWSKIGDNIYDPFGGSGTTLIASEQLGRTCYMMELDPGYCDVIRERYEKLVAQNSEKTANAG